MKKFLSVFKPFDIVICVSVIMLALILWLVPICFSDDTGEKVSVTTVNGEYSYSLGEDGEYEINSGEYTLLLCISGGSAYVKDSDCKDRLCVKSGAISKPGEVIICAPARVCIRIVGLSEVTFDAKA